VNSLAFNSWWNEKETLETRLQPHKRKMSQNYKEPKLKVKFKKIPD